MKLRFLTLAALSLLAVTANAQAIVIYDTITNAAGAQNPISIAVQLPRFHMGDGFSTLAAPPGKWWRVSKAEVLVVVAPRILPGTFPNSTARLRFFNDWNPASGAAPTFSSLASDSIVSLGTITTTWVTTFVATKDFAAHNLAFDLADGQSMGLTVSLYVDGIANNDFTLGLTDTAPTFGSSSNFFYQDQNGDGILQGNEGWTPWGWTNSNAMYRIHAEAVPEPATLLVLGAGATALAARRRRKK